MPLKADKNNKMKVCLKEYIQIGIIIGLKWQGKW